MRIPNAEKAIVDNKKLNQYLLSSTHPIGKYKAEIFSSIGYSLLNIETLKSDLLKTVCNNEAIEVLESEFGKKYIIQSRLGITKEINVITIWIIEKDEVVPRFVTAYPDRRKYNAEGIR